VGARVRGGGEDRPLALYLWFFHREQFLVLEDTAPTGIGERLRRWLVDTKRYGNPTVFYGLAVDAWLLQHDVLALDTALLTGRARTGQLVWCERPWLWSDAVHERRAAERGEQVRSTFQGAIELADRTVRVHGTFNPVRMTSSSSNVELAGTRSHFVLATVTDLDDDVVELRPIVIATRLYGPAETAWYPDEWQWVHPRQVDQFSQVDWDSPLTPDDLIRLKAIPERTVKEAIARLIGEPTVPKDWGGERNDLWTTRLMVDGRPHRAAFLLKGPAKFAPMTIAMLGKNGDQVERLSQSPADLLVVQHCHEITEAVHGHLKTYASVHGKQRRYMLIDGYDTYRILSAAGALLSD
jgi:hypothetical protein